MTHSQEISAVVVAHTITGEILLMTEPDKMPADIAPFKIIGNFRLRPDGTASWDAVDHASAFLVGTALAAFAAHVDKLTAERRGAAVAWLERLHSLEVKD
jgi:hypothetical protein